jgi:hypothetical protein
MSKLKFTVASILFSVINAPLLATASQPNSLEHQLAEIALVISASTKIVKEAWAEPLDALESMTTACEAQGGITNDATKVGGLNSVTSTVCDENGQITITLRNEAIDKALRNSTITLTPVKLTDTASEGYQPLIRSQEYFGTPANQMAIDSYTCVYQFGAEAIPVNFQYSQPPGAIKMIDHFAIADRIANIGDTGLSSYCSGMAADAIAGQ